MKGMENADWRDKLLQLSGFSEAEVNEASVTEEKKEPVKKKATDKLSIFIEKKGRGGKTATIVAGFTCSDDELRSIASELKNKLGCGGSSRGGEILIQGNRREDVQTLLRAMGYRI